MSFEIRFFLVIYETIFSVDLHDKKAEYKIIGKYTTYNDCDKSHPTSCAESIDECFPSENFSTGTKFISLII